MKPTVVIVLFALLLAAPLVDSSTQSIAVHGWLRCKNEYVGNVPVRLFDKDTVDPDDLLSETRTSTGGQSGPVGYFNISGSGAELTKLDPELRITHNCTSTNVEICSRVIIPQSYLTDGSATPAKSYNAEVLTLEDKENDC
ncbi:Transthyretin-like family and Immunoglobulin-like fold domain-containing protein [Aphelenchoides fujianensis]|nr:Transthyretin-like family and Immunoglobulin-like fold domain-containing protein [Aphelenchoides fujianensis]